MVSAMMGNGDGERGVTEMENETDGGGGRGGGGGWSAALSAALYLPGRVVGLN